MSQAHSERVVSAADLMAADSLATMDLKVDPLRWSDGTPMRLKVRALTFSERRAANRAAIKAGGKDGFDRDTWAIEVVWRGLVEPRLTEAQKQILWDLPANVIDEACDGVAGLGAFHQRTVDARLEQLAGLAIPPPPDARPDSATDEPGGSLD